MPPSKPMAGPNVLYETDLYREWPAPAGLRDAIACVWTRQGDGAAIRVLPDGCTDLVWRAGSGAVIAGPDTGPVLSPTARGERIVGVRLANPRQQ